MKHLLKIAAIVSLVISCDDSKDFYTNNNKAPIIAIKKYGDSNDFKTTINDSLKINNDYKLEVYLSDDYSIKKLTINYLPDTFDGDFLLNDNNSLIQITPKSVNLYPVQIICNDMYGKSDTAFLNLEVFKNLSPVASFEYSLMGDYLKLDFKGCYDLDEKYGGKIVQYELSVNDVIINTDKDVLYVDINPEETYILKLRVKDNDGAWSAFFIEQYQK
jgi:hypothetical protein